jgi:hypothetical protein
MTARPKTVYIRSKKLMEAYRAIPCQSCGRDDGSVCGAHANLMEFGKGRGIKASDDKCASLCSRCHAAVDSGYSMSREERREMWLRAHHRTVEELTKRGLWI